MSSLMLYPVNPVWVPQQAEGLEKLLHETGLTGDILPEIFAPGFSIGGNFLSLVTFMGCAPAINLQPDIANPADEYCAVRILHTGKAPCFLIASRYSPPRCPRCRAAVAVDVDNTPADTPVACERCGEQSPLHALNWRRSAGYACCFVEITGVHPQEALPTEALLNVLQAFSDCEWRYFYY